MVHMLQVVYSVSFFSTLCSLLVIFVILWGNMKTISSRLTLYLHLMQLLDDIVSLPNFFVGNSALCAIFGFLHYYSSFAIISINTSIIFSLYRMLFANEDIESWRTSRIALFAFGFPLITILPFSTNSYGKTAINSLEWCTLKSEGIQNTIWCIMILYLWVWLMLIFDITGFVLAYQKIRRLDSGLNFWNLLANMGVYPIISALSWIPRTIVRISILTNSNSSDLLLFNLPIYICGVVFSLVFALRYSSLKSYESYYHESWTSHGSISTAGGSEFGFRFTDRFTNSRGTHSVHHKNSLALNPLA